MKESIKRGYFMSNIIDYIKWRGDLTFSQDPFNEIDNLILSQFSWMITASILRLIKIMIKTFSAS